ncbi:MAG: hypothetical protein ABGY24_14775 [bacterium]
MEVARIRREQRIQRIQREQRIQRIQRIQRLVVVLKRQPGSSRINRRRRGGSTRARCP